MSNPSDFDAEGIVFVDSDEEIRRQTKEVFEGRVELLESISEAEAGVTSGNVDVVFIGPSLATAEGVAEASALSELDPDLVVILAAPADVAGEVLRAAIRSGLSDVVEAPLTIAAVTEALKTAQRRDQRRAEQPSAEPHAPLSEGRIITVMAAKGGSGKTVFASNVATLLARWGDASRVVIADADLQFGDVALVLQVDPKHTVVNAAKEGERLDNQFLETVLATHSSGMRVLAAPLEPAFADEVPTPTYTRILGMLREMFDYVVVDTAPSLDERLLAILDKSDVVLFVVDMDLPSVKNAKLALETLRILNYPSNKIKLVLNRSNSKARLDVDEIERSLRLPISASVPSDGLLPASINEGIPIVESHPKSKPAKAFEDVTQIVMDTRQPSSDANKKRRFGR
ncbi:MAG: AAA family ATPase [Acidimicrobiia bacterium]